MVSRLVSRRRDPTQEMLRLQDRSVFAPSANRVCVFIYAPSTR